LGLLAPTGSLMAMALSGMLLTVFPLRLQKNPFKDHPFHKPDSLLLAEQKAA
jgi:hypothetical protein